ncbi:hypothetical protein [Trichlorobacter sp.]|uniref:hypothetical protein n=1 Tax=Trichlorobacter sp. TaxID=2911007 RepID=UPI00243D877D|nr:hypothetical protein [Trichlorobacter sp.]MCK9333600.1 hypothetical protein [Candidatus Cloacimonadota bacterium]MDD2227705.1 hypothetical protein [Clostridia bacterium]MDY0385471.1 hypothetical protein [Trichlorobacter sp.]
MSKYSEFINEVKNNQLEKFFGKIEWYSNKYFRFNRYIDEDNIIIITNDLIFNKFNSTTLLIVGSNQAVYLKDWQVFSVSNYDFNLNTYAVKLNRKYFKIYTFQKNFEDFIIEKTYSFDDLVSLAKNQDLEKMTIRTGHLN